MKPAMSGIDAYIAAVELAFISSPIVAEYRMLRVWANTDDGYVRVRATMSNGDFLEAAEYFALQGNRLTTIDYRYQWMNASQRELHCRWDCTPDHPELEGFPHHAHVGDELHVTPGRVMSMLDLLRVMEDMA